MSGLPRVKIDFENGALKQVSQNDDVVLGYCLTGVAVAGKFALSTAYTLRRFSDLENTLGITTSNNPDIVKVVKEFYSEAEEGKPFWMMGFPDTVKLSDMADKDEDYAAKLIQAANGKLTGVVLSRTPAAGYSPTVTAGIDADCYAAATKAQALCNWAAQTLYSPIFVMIQGYAYTGDPTILTDLHTMTNRNVMIMIGDTVSGKDAAVGVFGGRRAQYPLEHNIARVKNGALKINSAFVGTTPVETADIASIHEKGFVTFRQLIRKDGYFFSDDFMATAETDDYSHLTAIDTINKAYRIAYDTMSEKLMDTIAVNPDGTMQAAMAKSWQSDVEGDIYSSMTVNGQLSADRNDPRDKGVICFIDLTQKVISTSKFEMTVRVRPFGYARYIDIKLGFQVISA